MTTLAHSPINDTRFNDLMKDVREFGREAAEGKDALPKLFVRVVRAANDGVITTDVDKKTGKDDAARIFEAYANAESTKLIHERTKDSVKAQVSKVRVGVKLGQMTTCDGVTTIERAAEIRKEVLAADPKAKVKSAFPAYVDVGRAQLESDTQLTDEQIKEAIFKSAGEDPTVEKELNAILKKLDNLVSGDKGLKDDDERTMQARDLIHGRLAALVLKREQDEVLTKAEKLGLVAVDPYADLAAAAMMGADRDAIKDRILENLAA